MICGTSGGLPRPSPHAQRPPRACVAVRAAGKGFGGGGGDGGARRAPDKKVSKRGKAASRPDPRKQLEALQAEQAEYEARLQAVQQQGQAAQPPAAAPRGGPPAAAPPPPRGAGTEESTPTVVTDRMLRRILAFAGAPIAAGLAFFPLFYNLKAVRHVDLPSWVPYLAEAVFFGGGLAGISYGILSASWDPAREGSALGGDEFRANLPVVLDRFRRKQ